MDHLGAVDDDTDDDSDADDDDDKDEDDEDAAAVDAEFVFYIYNLPVQSFVLISVPTATSFIIPEGFTHTRSIFAIRL